MSDSARTVVEVLIDRGRCGVCADRLGRGGDPVHLVMTDRLATWAAPAEGHTGTAIGLACTPCLQRGGALREVVEVDRGEVRYHALARLQPAGMVAGGTE